ncbi:alpha-ketoglutarate-dependent taurine dioxygenase [Sphingomonas sp. BK580]|nr:alpha-ketoglutarate-dependent taurine dioxygenase [Sphingomonas sp. BK580]
MGERALVLGAFFKRFVGLGSSGSQRLFETFQVHVIRRENTRRRVRREGDVAMWDNQATQRHALADDADQRRVVRRVTIHDEAPVPVDGRTSRQSRPAHLAELKVARSTTMLIQRR